LLVSISVKQLSTSKRYIGNIIGKVAYLILVVEGVRSLTIFWLL